MGCVNINCSTHFLHRQQNELGANSAQLPRSSLLRLHRKPFFGKQARRRAHTHTCLGSPKILVLVSCLRQEGVGVDATQGAMVFEMGAVKK